MIEREREIKVETETERREERERLFGVSSYKDNNPIRQAPYPYGLI